jgi:hypothetical protein
LRKRLQLQKYLVQLGIELHEPQSEKPLSRGALLGRVERQFYRQCHRHVVAVFGVAEGQRHPPKCEIEVAQRAALQKRRHAAAGHPFDAKPGGQIILVNHLYSERGLGAAIERLLAQKARALGLRPEFPFARLAAWAQTHGGAELIERRKVPPFGVYTLVRFRRCEPQSAAA